MLPGKGFPLGSIQELDLSRELEFATVMDELRNGGRTRNSIGSGQ